MKAGRAVRLSVATVTTLAAVTMLFVILSGSEAEACRSSCVKPTTTTTLETTTTLAPTTTLYEETTTTLEQTTTTTIPTEVLPTVIVSSTTTTAATTTSAEVGGIEVLPFTGYPSGALVGLATSLLAVGAIALLGARRSRSEE